MQLKWSFSFDTVLEFYSDADSVSPTCGYVKYEIEWVEK